MSAEEEDIVVPPILPVRHRVKGHLHKFLNAPETPCPTGVVKDPFATPDLSEDSEVIPTLVAGSSDVSVAAIEVECPVQTVQQKKQRAKEICDGIREAKKRAREEKLSGRSCSQSPIQKTNGKK